MITGRHRRCCGLLITRIVEGSYSAVATVGLACIRFDATSGMQRWRADSDRSIRVVTTLDGALHPSVLCP